MDRNVVEAVRSAIWALLEDARKFEQLADFYKGRSAAELHQKAAQAKQAVAKLVDAVPEAKL